MSFVGALKIVYRDLNLVVGYSKRDEWARLRSSIANSGSCGCLQSWTKAASDSRDVPKGDTSQSSASVFCGAMVSRDYFGQI